MKYYIYNVKTFHMMTLVGTWVKIKKHAIGFKTPKKARVFLAEYLRKCDELIIIDKSELKVMSIDTVHVLEIMEE